MRIVVVFLLALGLQIAAPAELYGCRCPRPTPAEGLIDADAVISGDVISISDVPDGRAWDNLYIAEIRVSECWKGPYGSGDTVLIRTGDSGIYCGYPFHVGTSYLVFGYSKEGALHTSICDPTTSNVDWGASQLGDPDCTTAVERRTWAHVKRLFK